MPRDSLEAVLRIRQRALDEAVRDFAEALRIEAEAEQATGAIEAAMAREAEAASDPATDDAAVEAFGVWLRKARKDLAMATIARERAAAETARQRAIVAAARAAVRAAEQMISDRAARRRAAADRREQHALDEIALRRRD